MKRVDTSSTTFDYRFIESISDRFDLLNVEADLRISLLCGFLSAVGSGKYINSEKDSSNVVRISLKSTHQTVSEKLFGSYEELKGYLDLPALQDPQYTHLVASIDWGANFLLSLEKNFHSEKDENEVKGLLHVEMQKLLKVFENQVEGRGTRANSFGVVSNDITIKIDADITAEGETPISVESFLKLLSELPTLLKKVNDGKGKPLTYGLIELSAFRKVTKIDCQIDSAVVKIKETFLHYVTSIFEKIAITKQKLKDLEKEINDFESYIEHGILKECDMQLNTLIHDEACLKRMISENWVSVKSGLVSLDYLEEIIQNFVEEKLDLTGYDDYLHRIGKSVRRKIESIKNFACYGAMYLEKDEDFSKKLTANPFATFVVLVISEEFQKLNPELFHSTSVYFLSLAKEKVEKNEYLVVDLDVIDDETNKKTKDYFLNLGIKETRCLKVKNGLVECTNLYDSHVKEKQINFARPNKESKVDIMRHKPCCRAPLQMACPGFLLKNCPPTQIYWNCYVCKQSIEYGFDEYFYCSCGRCLSKDYEFRCGNGKHDGNTFVSADNEFVKKELSLLRPFNELNILVLGQSGVGKSTWINSIVNYFIYESLEEAKRGGVICTIPTTVTAFDPETYEEYEIQIGEKEDSEVTEIGKSGTQHPSTYTFFYNEKFVRIIDTPGIGDTRGIQQDKINLKCVIDHLSFLNELHGLCVLLNATDTRIHTSFLYCLKEFLIHLPKSMAKNIVFCYTNARCTCYTPGKMGLILRKALQDLNLSEDISLGHHNTFILDNEAFLYLCRLKHPEIKYDQIIENSFAQSWSVSVKETQRLISTVQTFEPRDLRTISSLYDVRTRILALSKPMAEISKTIQINLGALDKWKQQIELSQTAITELEKKLFFDQIHLEPIELKLPRTVCTASKCVRYHVSKAAGITEIEYVTHCHVSCYLKGVEPRTTNNYRLKGCSAMDLNGNCKVCGCNWSNHIHLTYEQKRVTKRELNVSTQVEVDKELSVKREKEKTVEKLENKIKTFEAEQDIIVRVSAKFGLFLKENAIVVYNDSVEEYLLYLIEVEKEKPAKTDEDRELLKNLEQTLECYRSEVQILAKVSDENQTEIPTVDEILKLEQQLYSLNLTGEDIKKNVKMSQLSFSKTTDYREKPLKIPKKLKKCADEKIFFSIKKGNEVGILKKIKNAWNSMGPKI